MRAYLADEDNQDDVAIIAEDDVDLTFAEMQWPDRDSVAAIIAAAPLDWEILSLVEYNFSHDVPGHWLPGELLAEAFRYRPWYNYVDMTATHWSAGAYCVRRSVCRRLLGEVSSGTKFTLSLGDRLLFCSSERFLFERCRMYLRWPCLFGFRRNNSSTYVVGDWVESAERASTQLQAQAYRGDSRRPASRRSLLQNVAVALRYAGTLAKNENHIVVVVFTSLAAALRSAVGRGCRRRAALRPRSPPSEEKTST